MATELAASIVAAASTLHEQHTERKILRVIEDVSPEFNRFIDVELFHEQLLHYNLPSESPKIKALCSGHHPRSSFRDCLTTLPHPRALWLVWHEVNGLHSQFPNHSCSEQTCHICRPFTEVKVPLAQMFAEGWTIEREIKPAADVSYLVLARTAPRQPAASS